MKKKFIAKVSALVAGVALAIGSLAGCSGGGADDPDQGGQGWYANEVKLPDGGSVMCVAVYRGGVTCDWSGRTGEGGAK